MYERSRIYGLDIETDTSGGGGLDPMTSYITQVAVAVEDDGKVFNCDEEPGSELAMLLDMDAYLRDLPPGLITTWNGTFFDLPFITDRLAIICGTVKITAGPTLFSQPDLVPKYEPLPNHAGGYGASWPTRGGTPHAHLDIAFAYKAWAEANGVSWSLKPVSRAHGRDPIELDRVNMHLYTQAEQDAYCLSDSAETRWLAIERLGA